MKRLTSALVAVAIAATLVPGCNPRPSVTPPQPTLKAPFTTDYALTDGNIGFFIDGDTALTAVDANPLYAGDAPLPFPGAAEFEKARAAKVRAILGDSESVVTAAEKLRPALAEMRSAYVEYAEAVVKSDKTLTKPVKASLARLTLNGTKQIVMAAEYRSLTSTEAPANASARSLREWLGLHKAMELGALYLQDVNDVGGCAAALAEATKGAGELAEARSALDSRMKALDEATAEIRAVASAMGRVDSGLLQLAGADHLFARSADAWIASELPKVKEAAANLTPREGLTAEDAAFVKAYAAAFEEWSEALHDQLTSLDTSGLAAAPTPPAIEGVAYAAENDTADGYFSRAMANLEKGAAKERELLAKGWQGMKDAASTIKTGAGVGMDLLGVAAQAGGDVYYGAPVSDTWHTIKANTAQVAANYQAGASGSGTLRTAGEYLEASEGYVGEVASGTVMAGSRTIFGDGRITDGTGWAAGHLTRLTAGLFTGFAKGVYKVADTRSNPRDVAGGMVDIGLSFIGGSKVIVKGSQIPGLLKGGGESIRNAASLGTNFVKSMASAAEKGKLAEEIAVLLAKNKITRDEAVKLIGNALELEVRDAVERSLATNREILLRELRDALASGVTSRVLNLKDTVKGQLADLFRSSFDRTLAGYSERIGTGLGHGVVDYFDNIVGSQIDPYVSSLIAEALTGPPEPSQMSGRWTGTMVVTGMTVVDENGTQGCDITQLKDKSYQVDWTVAMGDDGRGTVSGSSGGSKAGGTIVYDGGAVTITISDKGSTIAMQGTAAFTERGMTMGGTWTSTFSGSKDTMSGNWSAAKK